MNKCANNDNSCSYILYRTEDGTEVRRNKKKFETSDIAIITAKKTEDDEVLPYKLVAYKCSKCGFYHIGHTNKVLTDKDKRKARIFLKYYKSKKE